MTYLDERIPKIVNRIHAKFSLTPPIPVEDIVSRYADLFYDDLPNKIDGLCLGLKQGRGKPKVILNKNTLKTRKRFTLGHELGHILIPSHYGNIIEHFRNQIENNESNPSENINVDYWIREKEADSFSSLLLMPQKYMEELFIEFTSINGQLQAKSAIQHLLNECDVSIHAAFIRSSKFLPKNNIICMANGSSNLINIQKSQDTNIPYRSAEEYFNLSEDQIPNGIKEKFDIGPYNFVNWWFPLLEPPEINKSSDWRALLKSSIDYEFNEESEEERKDIAQSLTGILAHINSRQNKKDLKEMYSNAIHRIEADNKYKKMLKNKDFQDFLLIKIDEMIKKRKNFNKQ
jgi:Zn-dependent peptidase ImmA (M78 family)